MAVNWAKDHADAIVVAWYPGEEGGNALADVLFGDYNPSGRLPVTFYKSSSDLPDFKNYSMAGRTYRFFEGEALYPFGHGLSYTTFDYSALKAEFTSESSTDLEVSAVVTNKGAVDGAEVVQVYVSDLDFTHNAPLRELKAFKRIEIPVGQSQKITFRITANQLVRTTSTGERLPIKGRLRISIGGGQPGSGAPTVETTVVRN